MTVKKWLKAAQRRAAVLTYEVKRAWRGFKDEVVELWQYWCFQLEYRLPQAWPFKVLAWILSKRVQQSQGFGKFRKHATADAIDTSEDAGDTEKCQKDGKSVDGEIPRSPTGKSGEVHSK